MKNTIAAALIASTAVVSGGVAAHAASHYSPVITWVSNHPCKDMNSVQNCAWNASERRGHGKHSFIIRTFPGSNHLTCIMFDERDYARTHDYCI